MQLTSTKNPLLQKVRRAAAAGRPTEDGLIVIEGPHLVLEASRGAWRVEMVLTTAAGLDRYANILSGVNAEVLEVSSRAFGSLSATETGQEILALVRPREWSWQDLTKSSGLVVMLDGIQDPGNAGTIVRSAEAFGAAGLVFLRGSAHVANGKFLRATAGSICRMPFLEGITPACALEQIRSKRLALYALAAKGRSNLRETDLRGGCVLAVGSEGAGVSAELLSAAHTVFVPTLWVESLNAAVACSIALFWAQEQRSEG